VPEQPVPHMPPCIQPPGVRHALIDALTDYFDPLLEVAISCLEPRLHSLYNVLHYYCCCMNVHA
jgi:hypothetical protein